MNKKRIIKWTAIIVSLIILFIFTSYLFATQKDYRNPTYYSSYFQSGYYKIHPETILISLDKGEPDVFVPLLGDLNQVEDLHNSISWTQADYLKIANALSQFVWHEPLDLKTWKVYFTYFSVGCKDNLHGFNSFYIVYYKDEGVEDWHRIYSSRLIEVHPWNGIVGWAGSTKFSGPLLFGWGHIDLAQYMITADNVLRIADENGGKTMRSLGNNSCVISVNAPYSDFDNSWIINYSGVNFSVIVDPYSGKHKVLR